MEVWNDWILWRWTKDEIIIQLPQSSSICPTLYTCLSFNFPKLGHYPISLGSNLHNFLKHVNFPTSPSLSNVQILKNIKIILHKQATKPIEY
jgi:hypothetical protein